ncbi:hypothetical protein GCM10007140_16960 [Priestia taiwanensis]|uniref:Uncharacterized protein n=1 Tax=Priestia taiwanensis TaxID=1347902 RepID=A0A917ASP2_9BACI|nr:hypothetical protein GCM10007140_16960 [Priestia taiwanensis]
MDIRMVGIRSMDVGQIIIPLQLTLLRVLREMGGREGSVDPEEHNHADKVQCGNYIHKVVRYGT